MGGTTTKLARHLSLAQVSERTTLSNTTLRRLIDAGRLPVIQVGRKLLVREDDVVKLLETNTEVRGADWKPKVCNLGRHGRR
jgi:excisionase family DNA binding protein